MDERHAFDLRLEALSDCPVLYCVVLLCFIACSVCMAAVNEVPCIASD